MGEPPQALNSGPPFPPALSSPCLSLSFPLPATRSHIERTSEPWALASHSGRSRATLTYLCHCCHLAHRPPPHTHTQHSLTSQALQDSCCDFTPGAAGEPPLHLSRAAWPSTGTRDNGEAQWVGLNGAGEGDECFHASLSATWLFWIRVIS